MNIKKFAVTFLIFLFFLGFNFVSATETVDTGQNGTGSVDEVTSPTQLRNPIGTDSPEAVIANVINTVLGIVGSLALLMFIYGGLIWMTSSGNKEMIDKGKNIIKWAAIGLVIIFSSYALVRFLITGVGAS